MIVLAKGVERERKDGDDLRISKCTNAPIDSGALHVKSNTGRSPTNTIGFQFSGILCLFPIQLEKCIYINESW